MIIGNYSTSTLPSPNGWYNLPYKQGISNDIYLIEKFEIFHLCKKASTMNVEDTIWMTTEWICVSELLSQIELARGKVLCTGLGLGIVPLLVANKPEVSEVHVLEYDRNVLNLFNIQGFDTSKLKIIQADAMSYSDGPFDSILLDHYNGYNEILFGPKDMINMSKTIRTNTNSLRALVVPFRWQEFAEYSHHFGLSFLTREAVQRYKNAYTDALDSVKDITSQLQYIHKQRSNVTTFN